MSRLSSSHFARARRFVAYLWHGRDLLRDAGYRRRTIHAFWIQTEPGWLTKGLGDDITDEEWEKFMEPLR